MKLTLDTDNLNDYRKFLAVRRCPVYAFQGHDAIVPDEYAAEIFGRSIEAARDTDYEPSPFLFDYQCDIARLAIRKRRFSLFIDCGYGKTLIFLEFARHALKAVSNRPVLIVSPLMVVSQTLAEAQRFYPGMEIKQLRAAELQDWLDNGSGLGITNYEAFTRELRPGRLGGLILDESSLLKSMYGKWGTNLLQLGAGLDWKLASTGTPAPNDRIEYANHAVFMGAAKTTNEFLATYFINRGQTGERWELKGHALGRFYRNLSHWCIFLSNPAVYGWKDNAENIPPIHVHVHRVELTNGQRKAVSDLTGRLFVSQVGGIGQRSKLGQIAKGNHAGNAVETLKPKFIHDLVRGWPDESSLIWCKYNDEQRRMEETFPDAGSIKGETRFEQRAEIIDAFKAGQIKQLISKPRILGMGLNLQIATRQVFSGLHDSYEEYYQAVKRSNRIGSTRPLNVHIPATEIEEPMIQNVLRKAAMIEADTQEQERIFKEHAWTRS